jgi:hypothetical protein
MVEELPSLGGMGRLGEDERGEDIMSLREKSSGSAPGARDITTYVCLRGNEDDCQGETEANMLWI